MINKCIRMNTISNPGWNAVWSIYSKNNLFSSISSPALLTVLVIWMCSCSDISPIEYISFVSSLIVSIGPNLLGFTLSGYALMMGLSNSEFVKGLIRYKEPKKKYSMFQALNSTFAMVLGSMFVTTLVGVLSEIIVKVEVSLPNHYLKYTNGYNWICLSIILFLLFYTINSIKDIVINIFNFGQYVQVCEDNES